jgi:hypothetical protein
MSDEPEVTPEAETQQETPVETPAAETPAAPSVEVPPAPEAETPQETPVDEPGAGDAPDANASRTDFVKNARPGDECICPDGRKGTVHSFDSGLVCIPNHDQG